MSHKTTIAVLVLTLCTLHLTLAEEQYANSSAICTQCQCLVHDQSTIMDCSSQQFRHIPANWPTVNTSQFKVTLSRNNLTTLELLPPTDAQFELVLSHCGIKEIDKEAFGGVVNIVYLDLSYNSIGSEDLKGVFQGPFNNGNVRDLALTHLDLSYNEIHTLPQKIFDHTPHLVSLNLAGNDFRVLDIPTQIVLQQLHLHQLNLADNELTELVGGMLTNNTGLIELDLSLNKLDFVPATLAHVGNTLEVLTLDGNPIIEMNDDTFLGLERVRQLSINNLTELEFVNSNAFAPLKRLTKLSLSNNPKLRQIDREAFAPNQTLKELHLHDNQLNHIDYELLQTNWNRLEVFEVHGNPLECSCDLHNIAKSLSAEIQNDLTAEPPYCADPRTDRAVQMRTLDEAICEWKEGTLRRHEAHKNFSIIRTTLIVLSGLLAVCTLTALGLGYARYMKLQRNNRYPFASQILYNPLSTTMKF